MVSCEAVFTRQFHTNRESTRASGRHLLQEALLGLEQDRVRDDRLECVVCHGADMGGANYAPVVLDIGNQFSDQDTYIVKTSWRAPAIDTVFTRFDTDASSCMTPPTQ